MNGTTPEQAEPSLSPHHFELFIRQVAQRLSDLRRLTDYESEHRRRLASIRDSWSSEEDMALDWRNACEFMALKIIEGDEIDLTQLAPASYPVLEDSWLQRIKQFKAYYIWEANGLGNDHADYFEASNEIRRQLFERDKLPIKDFAAIRTYIRNCYLKTGSTDKLDDHKQDTLRMIKKKAHRIHELTHDHDASANWYRARLYVTLFYENIIGAVESHAHRLEKTLKVLRAFQFSKSPRNRYWIVNAFEAAIAISFLDKDTIYKILDKPAQYDFSMERVDDWPPVDVPSPNNMSYDKAHKQLIYLGHMTESERDLILAKLEHTKHRRAVENLYEQCQLGSSFKDMIL
jgi:hypothetical protein